MKKLIILIFIVTSYHLRAQFAPSNIAHERYWYYKTRLNNDFLKVGLGQGASIPMATRNLYSGCNQLNAYIGDYGDELTLIGPYLGVLATEFYLLKQNGQSTDKIRYELYCALSAVNRLDYNAESKFVNPLIGSGSNFGTNSLNGFMLKDDMYPTFLTDNYSHFNYFNSSSNSNGNAIDASGNLVYVNYDSQGQLIHPYPKNLENASPTPDHGFCETGAAWAAQSQFITYEKDYTNTGNETGCTINQDSYISLLNGLRLIAKYVDGSGTYSTYNNQNFSYSSNSGFVQEAKDIGNRIQSYFHRQNWDLSNPVTGNGLGGSHGGNVVYAYALSEANCHLNGFPGGTDGDVSVDVPLFAPHSCYQDDTNHDIVPELNAEFWNVLHNSPATSVDNTEFTVDLLSTCDCGWDAAESEVFTKTCELSTGWLCGLLGFFSASAGQDCSAATAWVCNYVESFVPIKQNNSYEDLATNVSYYGFYHAPLLYEALNGLPSNSTAQSLRSNWISQAQSILVTAPCEGPYVYNSTCYGGPWFSSRDLLNHPESAEIFSHDVSHEDFKGNHPGLDYLLYYNLLKIIEPNGTFINGSYFDLSDRVISSSVGCPDANPCTIGAFETIEFTNNCTVSSGSQITFRAGKHLNASAGSPISSGYTNVHFGGSSFTGYIHLDPTPYICGSNGNYQRTTNTASDYGDMGSVTPTHFIQYDKPLSQSVTVNNLTNNDLTNSTNKELSIYNNKSDKLSVFPNPNGGSFSLNIQLNENETLTYEITDVIGNSILKETDIKSTESNLTKNIDLTDKNKGMYYIRVITSKGYMNVKSIVIQ